MKRPVLYTLASLIFAIGIATIFVVIENFEEGGDINLASLNSPDLRFYLDG